jgi:hypothetical protein
MGSVVRGAAFFVSTSREGRMQATTLNLALLDDRLKIMPWIAWGARHVDELDDLIAAAREWVVVPFNPLRPKWEATKAAGDTAVGIFEDAPPFTQNLVMAINAEALKVEELKFGGTLLKMFLDNLPAIIALFSHFFPGTDPKVIDVKFWATPNGN